MLWTTFGAIKDVIEYILWSIYCDIKDEAIVYNNKFLFYSELPHSKKLNILGVVLFNNSGINLS